MATKDITDAVVVPQGPGTGLGSDDDRIDSATVSLLCRYARPSSYHDMLTFSGHDGTNDQFDLSAGIVWIQDDSTSTSGSRGSGGNPQIQSSVSTGYDTEVPIDPGYLVIIPSSVVDIPVSDSVMNDVWVNITDVTSNNAVEVRTSGGGGTTSAPSDTFVKIGQVNPDDSTADILENFAPPGEWVEDPNSPQTPGSVSAKQTYTFGVGEAERARMRFDYNATSGGAGRFINFTVNNNTNAIYSHGSTRDDTHWPLLTGGAQDNNQVVPFVINAYDGHQINGHMVGTSTAGGRFTNNIAFATEEGSEDGPLTTVEYVEDGGNSVTYDEVYVEVMVPP